MSCLPMLIRLGPLHERLYLCRFTAPRCSHIAWRFHGALEMLGVPRPHAAGIGIADFFECSRVWILSC